MSQVQITVGFFILPIGENFPHVPLKEATIKKQGKDTLYKEKRQ